MKYYFEQCIYFIFFIFVYSLCGALLISYAPSSAYQSILWPCAGFATTLVLLKGYRAAIVVVFSGLLIYAWHAEKLCLKLDLIICSALILVPGLQVVIARYLVNKFNGCDYWMFHCWRKILGFFVWGALIPSLAASFVIALIFRHEHALTNANTLGVWLSFFAGNVFGVGIISPCLLLLQIKRNSITRLARLKIISPIVGLFTISLVGYSQIYALQHESVIFKELSEHDFHVALLSDRLESMALSLNSARNFLIDGKSTEHNFYSISKRIIDANNHSFESSRASSLLPENAFFGFGLVKFNDLKDDLSGHYQLTKVYPLEDFDYFKGMIFSANASDIKNALTGLGEGGIYVLPNVDVFRKPSGDFCLIGLQSVSSASAEYLVALILDATKLFSAVFNDQRRYYQAVKVEDIDSGRVIFTNDSGGLFSVYNNSSYHQSIMFGNRALRVSVVYDSMWLELLIQDHLLYMSVIGLLMVVVFTLTIIGTLVGVYSLSDLVSRQAKDLENEKRFMESVFDHLPVFVSIKSENNRRYLRVNKAFERFFGVAKNMWYEKTAADIFNPADALLDAQSDDAVLTASKVVNLGGQWLTTAEGKRCINTQKLPIYDAAGDVVYILGISEDVTEQVEYQASIARRNELISLGLDAAGLGSWEWLRSDDRFILSPTLCAIIGVEPDSHDASTEAIMSLLFADDLEQLFIVTDFAKKTLETTDFCCRIKKPNDEVIWVTGKLRYFKNEKNVIFRSRGVLWDSTDETLLQQDNVRKTEALKRSNAELDSFAYVASHDLKEPLRGISNYATFLQEDYAERLDAEGVKMLQSLVRLTGKMEKLISDLLSFSRLGRTDLAYKKTHIDDVVVDVLETLLPRLNELNVHVYYLSPMPVLLCDSVRVKEIFRNLITNAMKYNDLPHKIIELGCKKDNDAWVFSVKDNGIGIAPAYQQRVFDMFKRLHGQQEYGGGSGVGLSIVQKIILQHGGSIWLTSTLNRGTTMFFSLPIKNSVP